MLLELYKFISKLEIKNNPDVEKYKQGLDKNYLQHW